MKYLVLLSGCGLGEGSQIEEVILSYLILDKYKIEYQPIAIDMQVPCINHLIGDKEGQRNVLIESARIGRGIIKNLTDVDINEYDGLIIPGGIGLIINYGDCELIPELINNFVTKRKPIAGMCSALRLFQKNISPEIFKDIEVVTEATGYCYDSDFNIFYTPAFRRSKNLNEISQGIDFMIRALIDVDKE